MQKIRDSQALAEEEEEIILREENEKYMEQAYNQLIAGRDPSKPIDWYGDPSVGAPMQGKGGAGDDDQSGALRVYDGVTIRIVTMPPVFKAPRTPGFKPGQCFLGAQGKVTHGFRRETGPGIYGQALTSVSSNLKKRKLLKKRRKCSLVNSNGQINVTDAAAMKGDLGVGVRHTDTVSSGVGERRAIAYDDTIISDISRSAAVGRKGVECRDTKASGNCMKPDQEKVVGNNEDGVGGGGGCAHAPLKALRAKKMTPAQKRREILTRAPSAETFGRTERDHRFHRIISAPSPAPSGGDRLEIESINGMESAMGNSDHGGGGAE